MQAIELVVDETTGDRTPEKALTNRVFEETKKRGLLVGKGGLYGNVFRIAPALNVDAVGRRRSARHPPRVVRSRRGALNRKNPKRGPARIWSREQDQDVSGDFEIESAQDRPHRRFAQPPLGRRRVLRLRLLQRDPGRPAQAEPVPAAGLRGAAGVPADREHAAAAWGRIRIAGSRPSRSPSRAASPTTTRRVRRGSSDPETSSG